MITDLFSHKIHSSTDSWPYKLIDIASVFAEFDGLPYDRNAIEERFKLISPRASAVARDPSKYRDEISAYPAYLGLYRMEYDNNQWVLRLSETAKRLLIVEEPNVPAFMLLQLLLFQYPNGNGASFNNRTDSVSIKPNAANKTLEFIRNGIHLSPLRLICKALLADSKLNGIKPLHPRVSVREISVLANDRRTNRSASPTLTDVIQVLKECRSGRLSPMQKFERRFHILNHTDLVQVTNGWIHLREAVSPEDAARLSSLLEIIANIDIQFNGFDRATTKRGLEEVVEKGNWGAYFDGVVNLTADVVQAIINDDDYSAPAAAPTPQIQEGDDLVPDNSTLIFKYPLRERDGSPDDSQPSNRKLQQADPEATRIKRQRSNLNHKILTSKLDEYLRAMGAVPYENEHIDVYAKIPNDGGFLFEIKSVHSENLLSQTRKGLSQLYEYRYRYKNDIGNDVTLCLVFPSEPKEIEWLQDYLCNDRDIAVCWFDNDQLRYPDFCLTKIRNLLPNRGNGHNKQGKA